MCQIQLGTMKITHSRYTKNSDTLFKNMIAEKSCPLEKTNDLYRATFSTNGETKTTLVKHPNPPDNMIAEHRVFLQSSKQALLFIATELR